MPVLVTGVAVDTCGQAYSGTGFLAGDLDCTGFEGHALVIERHGSLELRGFTLTGGNYYGVGCFGSYKIIGPGTITGSGFQAVRAASKAMVSDVTISGNRRRGVDVRNNRRNGRARIIDSLITGNGSDGAEADTSVRIINSTITGNAGNGVEAGGLGCRRGKIVVRDSTVTGNGLDAECGVTKACADLASCCMPKLWGASTCDARYDLLSGFPGSNWGICTLD